MENKLNFVTPTECLKKQIEENENLTKICNTINNSLITYYNEVGKTITISIEINEEIDWKEQFLLKSIYKRFGWKLVISHHSKLNYDFLISEIV